MIDMEEWVATALSRVSDVDLSNPHEMARAAMDAVRAAFVAEAEQSKFHQDRNALFCAVETIDEALK